MRDSPAMYFQTRRRPALKGVWPEPGEVVWSRVYVEHSHLHVRQHGARNSHRTALKLRPIPTLEKKLRRNGLLCMFCYTVIRQESIHPGVSPSFESHQCWLRTSLQP